MRDGLQAQLERIGRRGHRALVAGVVRDGVTELAAWSRTGAAPDADSLFEIGSITKVFTGVLLADMALRGELSLDDPLSRHLPSPRPGWRHREPTLLELATHRSGLPNVPRSMGPRELFYALGYGSEDPWAEVGAADYAELVARESPRREPGGKVRYSSMAVGLLGDALAARAGKPYEDLLAERVLEPLGMDSTAVTLPPPLQPKLLRGHTRRGRPAAPIEDLMPAAGSLRSSARDMLRFLAASIDPPPGSLGAALELARQPHARIGKRLELGLCWMLSNRPGRPRVIWHNGGTWGFRSFAGLAPETRTGVIVMANTARGVERLGFRLAEERAG